MEIEMTRNRRTKAEVEAVREAAREELRAAHPMTLRQVHYRLVSRSDVNHPNTIQAYQKLSKWLRDDRLNNIVPWSWMEDRMRVARGWNGWAGLEGFVEDVRDNYYRDPWQDQSGYVEVWLEKDALSGVFMDVLGEYRATLNVGRGYDGWTSIKRAADRYRGRGQEGIDTTVLYFGDFDPSGEDMHRSLQERFATLGVYPEMPKVALTHEDAQVLPGDVTKADDSRAAAFVAKYGDLAVELDALPVGELRSRIQQGVEAWMDMDALSENARIEREQRQKLRDGIGRLFEDNEKDS